MNRIEIIFKSRIVLCVFALLGLAVLWISCATKGPSMDPVDPFENVPIPKHAENVPIPERANGKGDYEKMPQSHLWDALYGADEEPPGYAMYTYVLINRSKADTAAWTRFEKLVESIMQSTTAVGDHSLGFNRSLYNLFLIPYRYRGDQFSAILNDILSKSILTSIAASVQKQELRELINTNPGPFLISAAEPISNENFNKDIDMLYVDLTRSNLDAMSEVVSAYKKRLSSDSIEGSERFNSIRLSLLNFILDADDYINIVKVSYAGWIRN